MSAESWQKVQGLLVNTSSDFEERLALREAIAVFEQEAALHTPVGIDQPKNTNLGETGRQDCLDESTNTTHFLTLLQNSNLLKWHRVGPRVYRAHFMLDQHYAAQLIHQASGARYVIDSWHLGNGERPYIQPYRQWAYKKSFSKKDNPQL